MLGRGYDEFIQEYGTRFQWDIPLMHKYIDWNNLFCDIKTYWNTEAVRHWREKALKQFIFNLPNVKNPMLLFHAFIQSDIFYLPQIISLVEIPPLACELRCEIWPEWYTITSSKEFAGPHAVLLCDRKISGSSVRSCATY